MDHALEYYSDAAELYLKAFKGYYNDSPEKMAARGNFTKALDKAELLKKKTNSLLSPQIQYQQRTRSSSSVSDYNNGNRPSLGSPVHNRSSSVSSLLSIEPQYPTDDILTQKLSSAEIEVLKRTSSVNEKTFLPWIDETDLKEQFSYPATTKYLDPEGSLRLSEKQIEKFGGWKRPADIMKYPQLICLISR
jgi:calpain-7